VSTDSILPILAVVVVVALAANVALMAIVVVPLVRGRGPSPWRSSDPAGAAAGRASVGPYDRLLRVVGFGYLLTLLAVVGIAQPAPANEAAILGLIVVGGIAIVVLDDLLVGRVRPSARYAAEAIGATVVTAAFVALTGGAFSPFIVGLVLVVVATAPIVGSAATVAVVALSAAGLLVAAAVGTAGGLAAPGALALVAVYVSALALIAAISTVVASEQRRAHAAAVHLSEIDQLTSLFNRTRFFEALDREIERSRRSGRAFCLLMADLDDLKQVNDTFGHDAGDRYIRGVADAIRRSVRRLDVPARYAGDEFIVLLPETTLDGALVVAEKIRLGVAALTLETDGRLARSSVSIGVVVHPADGATADELVKSADRAMYASKRMGKDRVVSFEDQATRHRRRIPVVADRSTPAEPADRTDRPAPRAYAAGAPGPDAWAVAQDAPGDGQGDRPGSVVISIDADRPRAGASATGHAADEPLERHSPLDA
jgi:diguanylate cyclase (GGDEF)-like protein